MVIPWLQTQHDSKWGGCSREVEGAGGAEGRGRGREGEGADAKKGGGGGGRVRVRMRRRVQEGGCGVWKREGAGAGGCRSGRVREGIQNL